MENTLKQKLAAGAQPIGTFFDTASVSLMECLGRTGLDFAIIDNEHSPIEAETTAALVRAAELSGICPIARVREISRPAVLKLLDVGVQGLIVPNVKTLEQVQELVNYAKYYPIGQRGFCPSRKDGWGFDGLGSVPETMRHFNGETLLFPQCETAEALAIIEDICAVDGVDGIFVGPFDQLRIMHVPVVAIRNGQQPVFLVVSIMITKVAIWLRRICVMTVLHVFYAINVGIGSLLSL